MEMECFCVKIFLADGEGTGKILQGRGGCPSYPSSFMKIGSDDVKDQSLEDNGDLSLSRTRTFLEDNNTEE